MRQELGYLGAVVAVAGLLLASAAIVASGLSFLLAWQALHLRGRRRVQGPNAVARLPAMRK